MGMTLFLWVAVALLSKPEPEELLIEFYKKAQPPGWWGQIPEKVGDLKPDKPKKIFSGLLIVFIGFVTIAAGTISFNNLYVARWNVSLISALVSIAAGILFRKYFKKFMDEEND
jgi:hypothetical protein